MSTPLRDRYDALVRSRDIEPDPAQAEAVAALAALDLAVGGWQRARRGFLSILTGRGEAPKGLYIHGAVGRGKTMLMDLFFDATTVAPKRRVHFHQFMAETHERIARARHTVEGDPIPEVAKMVAAEATLLCFDEFHVTDIADAMILGRLFKGLLGAGVVVVATSNAHPRDLYRNGLNRQLFLPFVDMLLDRLDVLELRSAKDFRLDKLVGRPLYFAPADEVAGAAMDAMWERLTGSSDGAAASLEVLGRQVRVPRAAMGVARFSFDDLCAQPLGSADYLVIARAYHTLLIDRIPVLTPDKRNEARRLINLVDTLYDQRTGLVASAEAEPDALYPSGDGADLFQRTASRLHEMRSETYLAGRADRQGAAAAGTVGP